MPTFGGLLKKVRTKDSSAKNQDGPTSPSKPQTAEPTTNFPTNSQSTAAAPFATPPPAKTTHQDSGVGPQDSIASASATATATDEPMTSAHASPQSHGVASANTPSIQNLLNSDEKSANGGVVAAPAVSQPRTTKGKYTLPDFTIQRTLGTGSFGRVHLVQSKHNQRFYAIKVLKKAQVVKMKQVEHTNDERRMLQAVKHPFLITLWGTFQDSKNLYMVMDFVEGGELFSLLRKSQVSRWLLSLIGPC
jgi:protein kinase A